MFVVDREKCIACLQCIKDCPTQVIHLKDGKADINNERCIKCGHCVAICPTFAIATDDYNMEEVKKELLLKHEGGSLSSRTSLLIY